MELALLLALVGTVCGLVLVVWGYLITTGRVRTWWPALLFVLLLATSTAAGLGLTAFAAAHNL